VIGAAIVGPGGGKNLVNAVRGHNDVIGARAAPRGP
jgi:hypothetical protein